MAPPSVEKGEPRARQTSREIFERDLPILSPLGRLGLTQNQFRTAMGLSEEAPSPATVRRALRASACSSPTNRRGPSAATAVSRALDDEAANPTVRGNQPGGALRRGIPPGGDPSQGALRTDAALTQDRPANLRAKLDTLDQKLDREVRKEHPDLTSWAKLRQARRRSTGTDNASADAASRMVSRRASAPTIVQRSR